MASIEANEAERDAHELYKETHRDELKAKKREYVQRPEVKARENENRRKRWATWYADHHEAERERGKDKHQRFREKDNERARQRYQENLEAERARHREKQRELRKLASEQRAAQRAAPAPKLPHRPPSEDKDYRITVVANCKIEGLNDYKISPHAYPLQRDKAAAWNATKAFLRRNAVAIAERQEYLHRLSDTERAAAGAKAKRQLT